VAALVALALLYAWLYGLPGGREAPSVERRFLTYPVIFALYFLALWLVYRRDRRAVAARRPDLILIIAGAALLRLVILAGAPPMNPDLGRHLWEGKVLLAGFNPYVAPPDAEVYDELREQFAADVEDPEIAFWWKYHDIRSTYGPVATVLFAVPHLLPLDPYLCLRIIMTCFDFGTVLLLVGLAGALRRAGTLTIVYAWSPLCLNGFADRGQMDAPMVFLVVLAAWLVVRRRPLLAGVAFGAALLTKVSPLLLLLPLVQVAGLRLGATFAITVAAGLAPFAGAGVEGLHGLAAFAERWRANDSVHSLVLLGLSPLDAVVDTGRIARGLMAAAVLAYALWRSVRLDRSDPSALVDALAHISAAAILLSPVVFPWYSAVMLAFLCFRPRASLLALAVVPMLWYLKFLDPLPGSRWGILAAAERRHQIWRIPAYAVVAALFVRDAIVTRRGIPRPDGQLPPARGPGG
jgi:hypothetical protein